MLAARKSRASRDFRCRRAMPGEMLAVDDARLLSLYECRLLGQMTSRAFSAHATPGRVSASSLNVSADASRFKNITHYTMERRAAARARLSRPILTSRGRLAVKIARVECRARRMKYGEY